MEINVKNKIFHFTRITLSILCLCIFSSHANAAKNQTEIQNRFDSIYFYTATQLSAQNPALALHVADSLYQHAETPLIRIKSLMLKSSLYQSQGSVENAISTAISAQKVASENRNYEWIARISGFLSSQFRGLGLNNWGKKYLKEGIAASQKLKDNNQYLYQAMVNQEQVYYLLDEKEIDTNSAIILLNSAGEKFRKLPSKRDQEYFFATNEELYAEVYYHKKAYKTAIAHLYNAIEWAKKSAGDSSDVHQRSYALLADCYLNLKDNGKALFFLNKTEELLKRSANFQVRINYYETAADYYRQTENLVQYAHYNNLFLKASKQSELENSKSVNLVLSMLDERNNELKRNTAITIALIIIFSMLASALIYKYNKKTEASSNKTENETNTAEKKETKLAISATVEKKILDGLTLFEESERFREKNISLTILAGILGVNTKYLSYVLNKYKQKDFNNYVNELRINYAIQKINNSPDYCSYKISYWAEDCGFSSHSKFTAIFKAVTGTTPSEYLLSKK